MAIHCGEKSIARVQDGIFNAEIKTVLRKKQTGTAAQVSLCELPGDFGAALEGFATRHFLSVKSRKKDRTKHLTRFRGN